MKGGTGIALELYEHNTRVYKTVASKTTWESNRSEGYLEVCDHAVFLCQNERAKYQIWMDVLCSLSV